MNRCNNFCAGAIALGLSICWNVQSAAQVDSEVSSRFIPQSAVAAAVFFPQEIATHPKAELFPREVVTAWGQSTLGIDPMSIASIVLLLDLPTKEGPPQWGGVIRFDTPTTLAPAGAEQIQLGDKSAFRLQGINEFILVVADERMILFGPEAYLVQMLAAEKTDSDLTRMIAKEAAPNRVVAMVDVRAIRPLLRELSGEFEGQFPPLLAELSELHELMDSLVAQVEIDLDAPLTIKIDAANVDSAQRVDSAIQSGLNFARQMISGQMTAQMDPGDPIQAAMIRYLERAGQHFQDLSRPTITGNSLEYRIQSGLATAGLLAGLFLPAVQSVREAARRTDTANRVRHLLLACLNHESAYLTFPGDVRDADGRPLLSWRVAILPFLEEMTLYEQFHLDEPWDSEHNLSLVEKMPEYFASSGVPLPAGKSNLMGVSGPGMIFGGEPVKLSRIADGTSNTIAIVEVDPDRAVPWSQPADWVFDPADPLGGLGSIRPAGFNIGFVDGSVRQIDASIDVETWKALLTIAGGEVVDDFR